MMRMMLKKNIRGSISILLIIILIPMMAVAGIIVDLSRYELSKSMVSSAGDLTMNAAMTYYDEILKDVYGLFAVSPTEAELQKNLYNYFADSLIANGIVSSREEFENDPNLQGMRTVLSGNTGRVIDLEIDTTDKINITGVEGTTIDQPEILKTQIVEFMKYRTPIYGAMSMLDGLSSLKNLSSQNKVLEKRTDVNEKIGDFNEACKKAYDKIKEMQDYESENFETIKWDSTYTGSLENDYKSIDNIVKTYGNINIQEFEYSIILKEKETEPGNAVTSSLTAFVYQLKNKYVFTIVQSEYDVLPQDRYKVEPNMSLNTDEQNNAKENLDELLANVKNTITIQELEAVRKAFNENNSDNWEDDLLAISTIMNISSYVDKCNSMKDEVRKIDAYYDYLCETGEITDEITASYETFMYDMLEYCFLGCYLRDMIQAEKDEADKRCKEINETINEKLNLIGELKTKVNEAKKAVGNSDNSSIIKALDSVSKANDDFSASVDKYAKNGEDSFYSSMKDEADYNTKSFSKEEVLALYNRLGEIELKVAEMETALNNITYCGKPVKDIASLSDAVNAYNSNPAAGYSGMDKTYEQIITDINEQDITFWRYLKKVFKDAEEDKALADEKKESTKNIVDGAKDNSAEALGTDSSVTIGTLAADSEQKSLLPSQGKTEVTEQDKDAVKTDNIKIDDKYKGFSKMLNNMQNVVDTLFSADGITKALKAGRDNLFVTDYCFNMFSYYTYEKEVTEETDRKTITGTAINKNNNQFYNGEIEYITFGGEDGESSVKKAKTYIFAIRFMCNSVYTVTSLSIDKYTVPPAMAIQAATLGIVPYKLPEIVFELALALAESYVDMERLSDGKSVPLFKNGETFTLTVEGIFNAASEKAKEELKNAAEAAVNDAAGKVTTAFNDVVDGAGTYITSNIEGWVGDYKKTLLAGVNDQIDALASKYIKSIADQLGKILEKPNNEIQSFNPEDIINNALGSVNAYISTLEDENIIKQIAHNGTVQTLLNTYIDNNIKSKITAAVDKVKTQSEDAYGYIMDLDKELADLLKDKAASALTGIEDKINNAVNAKVSEYKTKLENEFGNAATVAADKVIEITNDAIDSGVDTLVSYIGIPGSEKNNGNLTKNSLLSFSYKQYMEMFLFLKLCTDSDKVMLRIADVLQMNMALQTKTADYQLDTRYTYIQLDAVVTLNTMLISNTWFSNATGNSLGEMKISYTGVRGY